MSEIINDTVGWKVYKNYYLLSSLYIFLRKYSAHILNLYNIKQRILQEIIG